MSQLSNINQASYNQPKISNETNKNKKSKLEITFTETKEDTSNLGATYEPTAESEDINQTGNFTVDMEKVQAMKDETDQRMLDLFSDTVKGTGLKQLGGLRGIIDKLNAGEDVTLEIEYSASDVEQAKIDVAPGGYWSADETSTRLVDFAKALSGGDPSKAAMLKDTFVKAFGEVEEMFGGELPELSYDTYDLTMDKFAEWEAEAETESEITLD